VSEGEAGRRLKKPRPTPAERESGRALQERVVVGASSVWKLLWQIQPQKKVQEIREEEANWTTTEKTKIEQSDQKQTKTNECNQGRETWKRRFDASWFRRKTTEVLQSITNRALSSSSSSSLPVLLLLLQCKSAAGNHCVVVVTGREGKKGGDGCCCDNSVASNFVFVCE
jgi:hypothetical protein